MNTVFFDLDETLIEHTCTGPELMRSVYETHAEVMNGTDFEDFGKSLWGHANQYWSRMFEPEVSGESALADMFGDTLRDIGVDADAHLAEAMRDSFLQEVLDSTRLCVGAHETLAELRACNVRLGIITNGYDYLQRHKIAHYALEPLVDEIIVSEAAGAHKPDERIFRLALERMDASPENAWHVGDNIENDIAGAEQSGLRSVLYDPRGDRRPDPGDDVVMPSHVIQALDEMRGLVVPAN